MEFLLYMLSGLIIGLGRILPVSADAHLYLVNYMMDFDGRDELLQLMCHLGCLSALWICLRHRIAYLIREFRLASTPARQRRRTPDPEAVMQGRFLFVATVLAAVMLLFRNRGVERVTAIPTICVMLLISGILLFLPQFHRSGNRDSRHMTRKDSLWTGFCLGLSVITGVSGQGLAISVALLRGMDKRYTVESVLLLSIPMMMVHVILDLIGLLSVGLAAISMILLIKALLAAIVSFFSAWIAVLVMRFLAVNTGFGKFAYYNWALACFMFILYLMV